MVCFGCRAAAAAAAVCPSLPWAAHARTCARVGEGRPAGGWMVDGGAVGLTGGRDTAVAAERLGVRGRGFAIASSSSSFWPSLAAAAAARSFQRAQNVYLNVSILRPSHRQKP